MYLESCRKDLISAFRFLSDEIVTLFLISFSGVMQVHEGLSSSLIVFNRGGFKLLLYAGGGSVSRFLDFSLIKRNKGS